MALMVFRVNTRTQIRDQERVPVAIDQKRIMRKEKARVGEGTFSAEFRLTPSCKIRLGTNGETSRLYRKVHSNASQEQELQVHGGHVM